MSDDSEAGVEVAEPVASWLLPLDGVACGDDLEYDFAVLELNQSAAGKPETQFSAAEPPQWHIVREQAEIVMSRTRDLRIAVIWGQSMLNTQGLTGLLQVLQLTRGLIDEFWDQGLHPALDPDDGDSFARLSVLGSLDKIDGLLGDVRQSRVHQDRRLGGLCLREVEVALDRLAPRAGESVRSTSELRAQFQAMPELAKTVGDNVAACLGELKRLQQVMNDRFGIGEAVDLKAMRGMLEAVRSVIPDPQSAESTDDIDSEASEGDSGDGSARAAPRGGPLSRIDNRQDAVRAINLVCEYLERSEPTNPAQLLLRRAERLIEKNFLQLVRELAPEAMAEVARIMGVDPDSVTNN